MRYALVLCAAALFAPASVQAADPPITFQTHSFDRLLGDLRSAADMVGGEKAVKGVNDGIKEMLGEKGFEGLDLSKPIVGYVVLGPKLEEVVGVIAIPITGEKEFLALCDRWNSGEKAKDLGKGMWELPALNEKLQARMKFSDGYAYIATGLKPEPALDAKALIAPNKLYDPAERGILAAKLHIDRLTPEIKKAVPTYFAELSKLLDLEHVVGNGFGPFGGIGQDVVKAPMSDIEKMFERYSQLLTNHAETATLRVSIDNASSDLVVEVGITPRKNSPLAKMFTEMKPGSNQFAKLLTPDTVVGFNARLPFFNDELKSAGVKLLDEIEKELQPAGPGKDASDELFKGLVRTVKSGEADIVVGLRGPDKDGEFALVGAVAFDDPSALEKEFKKFFEKDAPQDEQDRMKWDADKAGKVSIHTYKFVNDGFFDLGKPFGGDNAKLAFAFAPKGIYLVLSPDPIPMIKDALTIKPADAAMLDIVINPGRMVKFVEKTGGFAADAEKALGKEDKLTSALSLKVNGGNELNVRFALNLRMLPRAVASSRGIENDDDREIVPPPPVVGKR